jgi:hypothetical protein
MGQVYNPIGLSAQCNGSNGAKRTSKQTTSPAACTGSSYQVGHPLGAVVGDFNGNKRPAIAFLVSDSIGVLSW